MAAPVPLMVGVTGHRDLAEQDIDQVRQRIEAFLRELQTRYPNSPIMILSAVAEGADTLVVESAERMGCQIQLILPMPVDLYREDFSGAARNHFEAMVARHPTTELALLEEGVAFSHERQYEQLGSFLTAHSHVLLALWDGKYIDAPGGTSQVVDFHQRDISPMYDEKQVRSAVDITDDESDLVYHIVCGRQSSGAPASPLRAGSAYWFTRDDQQPRTSELPIRYHQVFTRLDRFNQDIQKPPIEAAYRLEPQQHQPDPHPCEPIQTIYGISDALAGMYQNRVMRALQTTLGAAVLAGLFFILYADFEDQGSMIWGYLLFVGLALGSYLWAQRQEWQRCYLDYRVLAESLRVQYYWALAGVRMSNPSRFSHDSFMQGRDLELGWIRHVMRYTGLQADAGFQPGAAELGDAIRGWVGDQNQGQLEYYQRKAGEKLYQHKRTQLLARGCFVLGLLAAALLALGVGDLVTSADTWLVALMGLLPIVAAARQTYAHRVAERELVAQYAHMHEIFANAHRLIEQAREQDSAERQIKIILRDLGEASLNENAQWVLRQRERPLPGGGPMG
ncbi:MAG: hypothetical protein AAF513_12765 [Pseudomonadota bacterium]